MQSELVGITVESSNKIHFKFSDKYTWSSHSKVVPVD